MIIRIELPKNAQLFEIEQDWRDFNHQNPYIVNQPHKYPCYGWLAHDLFVNGIQAIEVYTFVYPD